MASIYVNSKEKLFEWPIINQPFAVVPVLHSVLFYVNSVLKHKKAFPLGKNTTIAGFDWDTKIAVVSMFWNTNMATVTSCESALLCFRVAPRDLNWENKIKK